MARKPDDGNAASPALAGAGGALAVTLAATLQPAQQRALLRAIGGGSRSAGGDGGDGADKLVFVVQAVTRLDASLPAYLGRVAEGGFKVGDEIRVTTTGRTARVSAIITPAGALEQISAGQAATLKLDGDIDAAPGDILSTIQDPHQMTDQFEATLIWIGEDAGLAARSYDIELAGQQATASITTIKHRVNVNTGAHEPTRKLERDAIGVCHFATSKPLVFDSYPHSRALGGFVLTDRVTHATVGAGLIHFGLHRAQNVHTQALSITRLEREKLNRHKGRVIWFTGLSGSGKSTLANALEVALHAQGRRTYLLDGDNVRQGLNKDLGFTEADRVENIRRIAEVARLMMDAGLIVMTAFISPFRREREMARELIGAENFIEVFVNTPLAVCEQRDVKGLYKKARAGTIPNFTGISSPYEAPLHPDVEITSDGQATDATLAQLIQKLD
jgi:bifunctional enzyme CysN/CysC